MSHKAPKGPSPKLMAYLYAINAEQAQRVGLPALAAKMRAAAKGATADKRPTEKEMQG